MTINVMTFSIMTLSINDNKHNDAQHNDVHIKTQSNLANHKKHYKQCHSYLMPHLFYCHAAQSHCSEWRGANTSPSSLAQPALNTAVCFFAIFSVRGLVRDSSMDI
jgi:hypothetical protein